MLTKHTVTWYHADEGVDTPQTTIYVTPNHHDYRDRAADRNDEIAYNRPNYDDACAMGKAVVVDHVKEPDDGKA